MKNYEMSTPYFIAANYNRFFDAGTMTVFRARIYPRAYRGVDKMYFVVSEKVIEFDGKIGPRKYTVREYNPTDDTFRTIGPISALTQQQAIYTAKQFAYINRAVCPLSDTKTVRQWKELVFKTLTKSNTNREAE